MSQETLSRLERTSGQPDGRALAVLPFVAIFATALAGLVAANIVSVRQFIGFGMLPLLATLWQAGKTRRALIENHNPSALLLALAGALITLTYGIRSYTGSSARLLLLAIALLMLAKRISAARVAHLIPVPGVLVVVGETVAGAPTSAEIIVGVTTFCLWLLILKPLAATQILETLRNSLLLAVSIILVAFAAGVSRPYTRWYRFDANTVESRGGLTSFRWYLPLSGSWEPPAVLAVVLGLVSITLLLSSGQRQRYLSIAGFLVSFVTVFGVNGRTAELVLVGGALGIAVGIRARWTRFLMVIPATAFMFLPLIYSALSFIARQTSALAVNSGVAASSSKFSTLEGRTYVWDTTLRVFSEAPLVRKLLGYGANGYITSGASGIYSQQFYGSAGSGGYRVSYYDTHNLVLGTLLSHGLFGIVVLLVAWVAALRRALSRVEGLGWAPPLIGAWVFGSMSSTSTSCTPSNATYGIITAVLLTIPFLEKHEVPVSDRDAAGSGRTGKRTKTLGSVRLR